MYYPVYVLASTYFCARRPISCVLIGIGIFCQSMVYSYGLNVSLIDISSLSHCSSLYNIFVDIFFLFSHTFLPPMEIFFTF